MCLASFMVHSEIIRTLLTSLHTLGNDLQRLTDDNRFKSQRVLGLSIHHGKGTFVADLPPVSKGCNSSKSSLWARQAQSLMPGLSGSCK